MPIPNDLSVLGPRGVRVSCGSCCCCTEVVPHVPYMVSEDARVVSERVVAYSSDQMGVEPSLDRIALAPGSD